MLAAGARDEGALAALRLPHVIAAADAAALQQVLCACTDGVPIPAAAARRRPLAAAGASVQVTGHVMPVLPRFALFLHS